MVPRHVPTFRVVHTTLASDWKSTEMAIFKGQSIVLTFCYSGNMDEIPLLLIRSGNWLKKDGGMLS